MNPIVVIPARMASTRLPGKPLAMIGKLPMILHVLARARAADIGPVIVAVAETELARVVEDAGGTAVLTDPALPSGSDRVWQAVRAADPAGRHDVVVNLQGDLPGVAPPTLAASLLPLADPATDIGTLVCPVADAGEAARDSVVKVACAFADDDARTVARALYFSRAAVPWGAGALWHHVGIYAYRRAALARFVSLPEAALERRERLEQLRALEAGMTIGCCRIGTAPFGVDTPDDLDRARRVMAEAA
ncbi:3-deoxy-manno-octulosonate cytidylyltransferase [Gluconacetobacter diazotrophicus PA1 5]|uniref:3-deoxy-manno-octulosonate cytidylyltransferase n=2 Tax=Gluconacetobacter diazotrophicus TaxID=33996 RepID=A0A7W4I4Y2_GLUDI|nr:3-deoxy-manno-octulosonate cytidylyltransferase [Gluconacetobacter diazotrophicus]ACI49901.1 3-deoxy-manno-octulosonate cytidylyltransferase [Gluconacetobacter diazotrophicus PA1 5]MBB2156452.1 3-deoxy-manno-octulosonate cytidylyltransferase [Gluconacetobacter diazotrophicus]TWB05945.1 3-deoxy-manno-octulosonate cytidylyltransferase (CMP-KDO synthetase) [Gluconacetobacter diazotrophicus]